MRADSRHRLSLRSRAPRPGTVWAGATVIASAPTESVRATPETKK